MFHFERYYHGNRDNRDFYSDRLLSHYGRILSKHGQTNIIEEIKGRTIKLIDSTTISLCLAMFDWAKFWTAKGGIKIYTCFDDTMMIPDMVNITQAKLHDSKGLAQLVFREEMIIVEDRVYFDFSQMFQRIKRKMFLRSMKSSASWSSPEVSNKIS